jgi:general secretion pathway protein D
MLTQRLHKQILIEAKIIEVQYSTDKTTGIDWSKFDLSINGSSDAVRSRSDGVFTNTFKKPNYLIGYSFSMAGLLKFLKTQGNVKIVSNPKIMTLNNQPAIINVGTEINYRYDSGSTTITSAGGTTTTPNYTTDSTFVGVTLDITPQVTRNNYIILKINPVVSDIADRHIDENGVPYLAPDIKIKQLSSLVMVKDNSKILIGGLISKQNSTDDTSVPVLSSIPIIGHAFKSKKKTTQQSELIIVIIPHIVNGQVSPSLARYEQDKLMGDELK